MSKGKSEKPKPEHIWIAKKCLERAFHEDEQHHYSEDVHIDKSCLLKALNQSERCGCDTPESSSEDSISDVATQDLAEAPTASSSSKPKSSTRKRDRERAEQEAQASSSTYPTRARVAAANAAPSAAGGTRSCRGCLLAKCEVCHPSACIRAGCKGCALCQSEGFLTARAALFNLDFRSAKIARDLNDRQGDLRHSCRHRYVPTGSRGRPHAYHCASCGQPRQPAPA
jgi:hypothetical protein